MFVVCKNIYLSVIFLKIYRFLKTVVKYISNAL